MVNQPINLETKTEDEPPPSMRIEGKELKIPDEGETPDSNKKIIEAVITSRKDQGEEIPDYEEISEAVEEAITSEEKEETLKDYVETETLKDYVEAEQAEEEEAKQEDLYVFDEEGDYETDYEQEEEQEGFFKEDEFFEVEVDYWNLLLPDDPIEDFREYFPDVKENIFAKNRMPYYNGGMAKRMVKNLLAGE
jgi:hypothetical protein